MIINMSHVYGLNCPHLSLYRTAVDDAVRQQQHIADERIAILKSVDIILDKHSPHANDGLHVSS